MKSAFAHLPLLVLGLLTVSGVAFLYAYMYKAIDSSLNQAALAASVVASQEQNSAQAQDIVALHGNTSDDRTRLRSFFVPDNDAVSFIEELERLGPKVGSVVSLSDVAADDTAGLSPGSFAKISAHVDVSGSWQEVMRTLMLSEVLPYQSSIGDVTMQASTEGTDKSAKRIWRASYDVSATMLVGASSSKPL